MASITGIIYGALHDPADGGRGGAVAAAIAFASLFVRPDFGAIAYKLVKNEYPQIRQALITVISRLEELPPPASGISPELQELKDTVNGIFSQIQVNSDGQTSQNFAIAAASIIATLSWGFGDVVACYLKLHFF